MSGLMAEREALERVARAMFDLLGDEFATVELNYSKIGPVSQARASAIRRDGTTTSFQWFDDVDDAIQQLRPVMYRTGTGTWLSARIVVTSDGSLDAAYNYSDPPWQHVDFAPDAYAADLERYPRDEKHIPPWLSDQLDAHQQGRTSL
jgi:hypothetical protein